MSLRVLNGVVVHLCLAAVVCFAGVAVGQDDAVSKKPAAETAEAAGDESTAPQVAEAVELFRNRNFGDALEKLKEAYKANPELPPPWVFMAQLYSSANISGGVRPALEKAVEETPKDPEAYLILGELALRERRPAEAGLLLERGMELTAQYSASAERKKALQQRGHRALATLAERRQDWKKATTHLEALSKAQPENAQVMVRMGRALFFLDQLEPAKQWLDAAAKANPQVLPSDAVLAQLHQQRGNQEKAATHLAAALKTHADDLQTQLAAARIELNNGNLEAASQHAAKALELDSDSGAAALISGMIALSQQNFDQAAARFQDVALQAPNNFAASNGLALALCEQESDDAKRRALEYAQSNVRKFPRQPEALATLGWTLYKAGQVDQAEQVLGRVFATGNISAATAYYMARIAVQRGRTDQAKRLLQSALDTSGNFAKRDEAEALLEQLSK
jgi:Tfp pilus assembly protein PilF